MSDRGVLGALRRALVDPVRRTGPIWRRERRRFFVLSQYRRFRRRISFRRRGFRWTGYTWDEDVTWRLYAYDDYQGEERNALAGWMRRNGHLADGRDLVVEVGANIGTTSLPLARDHGCRVLAIEPEPENFELLETNVRDNALEDRITCERAAVASRSGVGTLVLPAAATGGVELQKPGVAGASSPGVAGPPPGGESGGPPLGREIADPPFGGESGVRGYATARTAPLSELLRDRGIAPSSIAFVWADVQGSEGYVIETAQELWEAGVPLYMELFPAALRRQGTYDTVAAAGRYGFSAFIESAELIAHEAPAARPIALLPALMERHSEPELMERHTDTYQTDVLLLPERRR